ncbi:hypothetical protein MTR_3g077010 [Medicago truncatula]|uniref:Uncharacterized protein n=1 Tax=Medicago truncatula TaxID=3880 RepID=G7J4S3_MEDTR|nr:hypothetical protein MTR_3g077010 [Medicago truncatula]
MRLPGVEPGSIAWKAIILTVGLQTLVDIVAKQNSPKFFPSDKPIIKFLYI